MSRWKADPDESTESTILLSPDPPPSDATTTSNYTGPMVAQSVCRAPQANVRERLREIHFLTYVLVCLFALSSWIDINGLWVEIPLLVNKLPEGWNLPSYLVIIIQVANIGPLTYTVANRLAPNKVRELPVIYIIIIIGSVSLLLMTFFWDRTSGVGGQERSTALLTLAAFLALVDCTSSVVYLPYMAGLKPQYITALYIGEGFSGLIPGVTGLIQGVGGEPNCVNSTVVNTTTNHNDTVIVPVYKPPIFSVEVFFFFLFAMMCVSGVSFTLLHFLPQCRQQRINQPSDIVENDDEGINPKHINAHPNSSEHPDQDAAPITGYGVIVREREGPNSLMETSIHCSSNMENSVENSTRKTKRRNRDEDGKNNKNKKQLTFPKFVALLVVTACINALTNGFLPSTQSYSALPYGDVAYTLAVRLSTVANPIACFLAIFLPTSSMFVLLIISLLGGLLSAYQISLAAYSPHPPLLEDGSGQVLVVITAVLLVGLFSYAKVNLAAMFRDHWGRSGLLWCGVVTQLGSFVGAVIAFILVNVQTVFHSSPPCH